MKGFEFGAIKSFLAEMMEKHGLDADAWRQEINESPVDQRQMNFSFDTDQVKDGFKLKISFIVTRVEIEMHPEVEKIMQGMIDTGQVDI